MGENHTDFCHEHTEEIHSTQRLTGLCLDENYDHVCEKCPKESSECKLNTLTKSFECRCKTGFFRQNELLNCTQMKSKN